jgi:hypothetical protein
MNYRISVRPHWINGWFLRLFSTPVLLAGSTEYLLSWSSPTDIEIDEGRNARIGVGVRYFGREKILGVSMTELPRTSAAQNGGPMELTFRNGLWNHEPFVLMNQIRRWLRGEGGIIL